MAEDNEEPSERTTLLPPSVPSTSNGDGADSAQLDALSTSRAILICASIFVLIFILTCNVSLVTTVSGPISDTFDSYSAVSWFTSAYLIALTSLIPVAGRLSIIFTPRWYLFFSIIIESIGIFITSQAPSLPIFLVGRAVTGIGAASVTPVAFILVTDLTSTRRRGLFFGCINLCYTTGVSCGAIIAGALEPVMGWRAVFWLQIPVTMSAAFVALFALPRSRKQNDRNSDEQERFLQKFFRIDFLGVITLVSAVVLLLYSLSAPKIPITPIVLSILDFALFIFVETYWAADPIVPVGVLKSRGNAFTGLATIGIMSARWSILFYTPVYAIAVRGWSSATAGLMLLPTNIGFGIGGILAGWLHIKRAGSFYISCLVCVTLFAATEFLVSQIATPDSNIFAFITALFANGFITGALLNYTLAHVLHLTPATSHPIVIPLNAMFRGLSGSFGSSISGGIFLRTLQAVLQRGFKHEQVKNKVELIRRLLGNPRLVYQLTGLEHDVAVEGYITALRTLFVVGSILALATLVFQAGTGWTAPDAKGDDSDSDVISPVVSREPVAG